MDQKELERLRQKYGGDDTGIYDPLFQRVAAAVIDETGSRKSPFSGISTFLDAPIHEVSAESPDFGDLQVAMIGLPMDLGVTNRPGSRFGPRAVRTIERIGPYNHVLQTAPVGELRVADVGDVPFRSRYSLESCHEDIEAFYHKVVAAGVLPLSVGGDHSVTLPVMKAVGAKEPLGMIHFDAHCDTGGQFDNSKFHHGGPFREAVLQGVLDPKRCIQIGIRGAAEYLWEFSEDSGMTVIHGEEIPKLGLEAIIAKARDVVGEGPTYITFDVDCLDPVYAPGTGTPEIGGVTTREALEMLRGLKGLNIVGGDVVEVAPEYDATTNTAQAGAQILFEILSLIRFSPALD
ncbi:agmatinase [Rhodovibrionaceae bacterium A322]